MQDLVMNLKGRWLKGFSRKGRKLKIKKSGSGALDFLLICIIVVVVGAALLAIMKTAMPDLFEHIIDMITSHFTI